MSIDGPTTVGAIFTQLPGSLSAALAGNGSGAIVATSSACSGSGDTCFDCPAGGCSAMLDVGATVTLTATAGADSTFAGWSAPCSGTGPCVVTIGSGAASVTATFDADPEALTVELAGSGAGNVRATGLVDCGNGGSACAATVPADTPIALTATPAAGSRFAGWSGACTGSSSTCVVSLHDAATVTADFEIQQYTLTVTYPMIYWLDGGTVHQGVSRVWGTVTGTGSDGATVLDCTSTAPTCSVTLPVGARVTLAGTPIGDAGFAWWSDGGTCSGSAACTITLTADTYVDAVFAPVPVSALTVDENDLGDGVELGVSIATPTGATQLDTCTYGACTYFIATGTTVDLYAFPPYPDSADIFEAWEGPCSSADPSCELALSADTYEMAEYGPAPDSGE